MGLIWLGGAWEGKPGQAVNRWLDTSRLPHAVWVTLPNGLMTWVWTTPAGEIICTTGRTTTSLMDEALIAVLLGEPWD